MLLSAKLSSAPLLLCGQAAGQGTQLSFVRRLKLVENDA